MKKIEKIRFALLCVSLVLIFAVLGIAFREKKRQIVIKAEKPRVHSDNASLELHNVAYSTVNKENFKEWDLKAGTAKYFKEQNRVIMEDLEVNLYRSDGKTYSMQSAQGGFNTESRNITMRGTVTGILPDSTKIQTDSVFYDHTKRLITTPDHVVIEKGEFSMQGTGMSIDLNNETLSILGKVKARGKR